MFEESIHFIDREGAEVAANECGNCGRGSAEALRYVDEYELHMCGECYDEAHEILAKEAAERAAVLAMKEAA